MIRTLIQVTALIVTLIASFFWIRGSISLTAKDMASLARTFYGYNSTVINNLAMQKADSLIAAFLLLLSFILQGVNMAWPMTFDDLGGGNKKGLIWAIIISFFIFVLSCWGATLLSKYYVAEAQLLLQKPKP